MENNRHVLFSNLVVWLSPLLEDRKRAVMTELKKINLKHQSRHMPKIKHNWGDPNGPPHNQFISINDFKPILDNYSSIKIIDEDDEGYWSKSKKISYQDLVIENESFLDNWMVRVQRESLFPEDYPSADYESKKISSYPQSGLESVKTYTFQEFCHSALRRKKSWFFQSPDPLTYKTDSLSASLTHLPDTKQDEAIELFDCLLRAAGEKPTEEPPIFALYDFFSVLVENIDYLREEGYLQVIKQIPSEKKIYLKVLACMAAVIQPSPKMYVPLLNYLYEKDLDDLDDNNKAYYAYCFFHLLKNFSNPRVQIPSISELCQYKELRKIPLTICFPKQKIFFIEAYTTVEELMGEIAEFYGLDSSVEYLLFIDNILLEAGILLDQLNLFLKDSELSAKQRYLNFRGFKATVVLKNMANIEKSPRCFNIMYNYFIEQYKNGIFTMPVNDMAKIGGLIMCSEAADEERYLFDFERLLPAKVLEKEKKDKLDLYRKHILKQYFSWKGDRHQARKEAISILETRKGYKTHFFKSKVGFKQDQLLETWVGLQPNCFIFVEPITGRIMRKIFYGKIETWGKTRSEVCIRVHGIGEYHIETRSTPTIASIFQTYLQAAQEAKEPEPYHLLKESKGYKI